MACASGGVLEDGSVGPVSSGGWVTKDAAIANTYATVPAVEIVRHEEPLLVTERVAIAAFLAGYIDGTRRSYTTDLRIFAQWCHEHDRNLLTVRRPHLEMFGRWMEQQGRMASTIARRLSSFYKYSQIEEILDKNPAARGRFLAHLLGRVSQGVVVTLPDSESRWTHRVVLDGDQSPVSWEAR